MTESWFNLQKDRGVIFCLVRVVYHSHSIFNSFFFVSQMGENERSNTRCNVSKIKDVVNVGTVEVKQQGVTLTLEVNLCIYTPFLL